MWLRDSTNEVLPYMALAGQDADLRALLHGVVMRQARSVLLDPYANAFNIEANGNGHQDDPRTPPMTKSVFEVRGGRTRAARCGGGVARRFLH